MELRFQAVSSQGPVSVLIHTYGNSGAVHTDQDNNANKAVHNIQIMNISISVKLI